MKEAKTCSIRRDQVKVFQVQGTMRAKALEWEEAQCILKNGEKALSRWLGGRR